MRGLLVLVGSTLMCASVASPAAPLVVVADRGLTGGWLRYGRVLEHVALMGPSSEPMGLLLLGTGFVLVAYQIRRKC